jgi:hypothetical protein
VSEIAVYINSAAAENHRCEEVLADCVLLRVGSCGLRLHSVRSETRKTVETLGVRGIGKLVPRHLVRLGVSVSTFQIRFKAPILTDGRVGGVIALFTTDTPLC